MRGKNALALEKSLRALTSLNDEHSALIEHARTLAVLVDEVPGEPKFHAEYREALRRLLAVGAPTEGNELDAVLREISA